MGSVVISYRILPVGTEVDFAELQRQIEQRLPPQASVYANYETEPIAFGLNALLAHIRIPEDKSGILEEMERNIEQIPLVSRIQTLLVRRAR